MEDDRDDHLSLFSNAHWKIQPRWVKALTLMGAVPAWLVLMISVIGGNIDGTVETVALSVFVATCFLQMAFLFRPYWRMDL